MKKQLLVSICIIACLVLISCKGDTGAPGDPSDGIMSMTFQQGVRPYPGYSGCLDNYLSSNNPTVNYETSMDLLVGRSASSTYRTLIKFDLSPLVPSNVTVKAAYLSFSNSYCQTSIQPIAAYKVTQFWDDLATWNTYNGSTAWPGANGGTYNATPVSDIVSIGNSSLEVVLKLDNSLVQDWLVNSLSNYGVIIIGQNDNTTNYGVYYNKSSEQVLAEPHPKLTIYYTLP